MALARGPVIVVALVATAGATVPVAVGLLGGDLLCDPIVPGFPCALCGSFALAYQPGADESSAPMASGALPAIGAAIAIRAFLTLLDAASDVDPYWATGGMHVAGWFAALTFLAASRQRTRLSVTWPRRRGLPSRFALLCERVRRCSSPV
jgi:hypothetical protein